MSSAEDRLDELGARLDAAHKRIDYLEGVLEGQSDSESAGADGRDQAVLDEISEGDRVGVAALKQLYRTHTDVRSEQTLKQRVKSLTARDAFVPIGPGAWRYRGESA